MNECDDILHKLAFATFRNINYGTATAMEARHISPRQFFDSSATELSSITGLRSTFFDNGKRTQALEDARRELDFIRNNNIRAIYCTDPDYPRRLAECDDAPAMLFVLGRGNLNASHVVAVVGTRHCTAYGIDMVRRLTDELKSLDDTLVISGLAYGIDIAAHRGAMDNGIPTGAVLAHGLNTIYPADHRDYARRIIAEGGFLATEYRTNSTTHRGNFLARNRIVAGMSDAVIVVESDTRGGAMATANIASAYNREVLAVPGRIYDPASRGCNELIARRQASIIRSAQDLYDTTGWKPAPKPGKQQELSFDLDPTQQRIVDHIRANPESTVNDMCVALALPIAHLQSILFEMEMDDIIATVPGNRYAVIAKC